MNLKKGKKTKKACEELTKIAFLIVLLTTLLIEG